jgi:HD-like signal output (HDOD) protein
MASKIDDTQGIIDGMKIPPAPVVISQLRAELQKDDPAMLKIADIISQDVGISALVLRTINSSFYGLRTTITSIQHAVSILGMANVTNIVTGLALRRSFEESEGANPPNHWESPVNVALVSADIAKVIPGAKKDEAYMLGLFHNAGHSLMMQRFPDYAEFLTDFINDDKKLINVLEDEKYNTNHATMSYFLAKSWGLSIQMAEIIRDHHNAIEFLSENPHGSSDKGTLLAILKMAEHIDKLFWSLEPDHEWELIQDTVLQYLGISEPDFNDIREDMSEKLSLM